MYKTIFLTGVLTGFVLGEMSHKLMPDAHAADNSTTITMPVRARIIQCGSMNQMAEACSKEPACCQFIEPAAGNSEPVEDNRFCETYVNGDLNYPVCVDVEE